MQHWRPYYKMASRNVHAESHGILWIHDGLVQPV
jgi:hypothetical protein